MKWPAVCSSSAASASATGPTGEPQPLAGFIKRFPHIPRVADKRRLLEDPTVQLILTAAIPADRAAIAIEAMRAGKDVATDKPGCTTADQLAALRRTVAETGRIWSVNYSERFEVKAVTRALELVARRRDRPRRADRIARPAPAEPAAAAGLVLPAGILRRRAVRCRQSSDRAIPDLHRLDGCRDRQCRGRQFRQSRRSRLRGFRRDAAAQRPRLRLYPGRLVHAGRAGELGRRAADHPRHRRLYRAAQIRRYRRPSGHRPPVPGG